MSLIAILLAMSTEGFWKSFALLRQFQVILRFARWLNLRFGKAAWFNGALGVLLTIGPGVIVTGVLQDALSRYGGLLPWLLTLAFSLVILAFCIGVRGMNKQVDDYLAALRRRDPEGAYLYVKEIIGPAEPRDAAEMNRMVIRTLLIRNNERLLAILFWFVVLGPAGAVIYRSTAQLKGVVRIGLESEGYVEAALRLLALLDWVPARITALCYAVIGSFVDAMNQWRVGAGRWRGDLLAGNKGVLLAGGMGALRLEEEAASKAADMDLLRAQVEETQGLVNRTVIAWLTVFALLTIAGWLA